MPAVIVCDLAVMCVVGGIDDRVDGIAMLIHLHDFPVVGSDTGFHRSGVDFHLIISDMPRSPPASFPLPSERYQRPHSRICLDGIVFFSL